MRHPKEVLDLRRRLDGISVKHTGRTLEEIEGALERDTFLTAEGAEEKFGLVDKVMDGSVPSEANERKGVISGGGRTPLHSRTSVKGSD